MFAPFDHACCIGTAGRIRLAGKWVKATWNRASNSSSLGAQASLPRSHLPEKRVNDFGFNWCGSGRIEPNTFFVRNTRAPWISIKDELRVSRRIRPSLEAPHDVASALRTTSLRSTLRLSSATITHSVPINIERKVSTTKGCAIAQLKPWIWTGLEGLSQGQRRWTCADICTSFEGRARLEPALFPAVGTRSPSSTGFNVTMHASKRTASRGNGPT